MSKYVLIIGQKEDPHIEKVATHIKSLGGKALVFNRYEQAHHLTYYYHEESFFLEIEIDNKKIKLSPKNIKSVWMRSKPANRAEINDEETTLPDRFQMFETRPAISSLYFILDKVRWINPLNSTIKINNKPIQLKLAQECKLKTPLTYITNKPENVLNLFKKGKVIYKSLSSFLSPQAAVFTTEIKEEEILLNKESVKLCPGIYQELIDKKYELRIFVVKDQVTAVKVDSQKNQNTKIDWRHNQLLDMYERVDIPENLHSRILDFHKKTELIIAAYDFILDRDNNYIFLECNPAGQWLWIEEKLDLNISFQIANALLA